MMALALVAALLSPRMTLEEARREAFQLFELLHPDGRVVLRAGSPDYSTEFAWPLVFVLGRHDLGQGWWAPRLIGELVVDGASESLGVFAGGGAIFSQARGLALSLDAGWQTVNGQHLGVIGGGPGWAWRDLGQLRAIYRAGFGGTQVRHVIGVDFEIHFDLIGTGR